MTGVFLVVLFLSFQVLCLCTWHEIRDVRLLVIGDSIMRKQKDRILQFNFISRRKLDYKTPYKEFFPNESNIPTILNSTLVFVNGAKPGEDRLNIVYINFGVLHLLHLHPIRKWTAVDGEVDRVVNGSMQASFKGFYNLEKWIRRDISLLLSTPYIDLVILMTPNTVCSSKFVGKYSNWFQNSEPLLPCVNYVLNEAATDNSSLQTAFFARPPKTLSRDQAVDLCAKGSLSINGTDTIATMMKCIVDSIDSAKLKLVDGTNITGACGCDCTKDGRHYNDDVVEEQTLALMEIVTEFKNKQGSKSKGGVVKKHPSNK